MDLYKLAKVVCKVASKVFFRPKYIGVENIPTEGSFIIAANHTSALDPVPIINITKRRVHFLAKYELFKFPKSIIFSNLELIPVYRDSRSNEALKDAIKYLKDGHVIGIFPEGTRERGRGLLEFKYGCVKMSKETNTPIIPVGIKGGYSIFKNKLCFKFGKPIYIKGEIEKENNRLRDTIKDILDSM